MRREYVHFQQEMIANKNGCCCFGLFLLVVAFHELNLISAAKTGFNFGLGFGLRPKLRPELIPARV